MAFKKLKFRIIGERPLLMHNGALSNPLNLFAKAIKQIANKGKNKTDADYEEMARLEFIGGLWLHNGEPCIPSEALEACFKNGAKKTKQGKKADIGFAVHENAPLQYKGPRDPGGMWATGDWETQNGMAFVVPVRIGRNKVPRTRARFDEWSAEFEVQYQDTVFNQEDIANILRASGEQCGLGDWIPKYGLFKVEPI